MRRLALTLLGLAACSIGEIGAPTDGTQLTDVGDDVTNRIGRRPAASLPTTRALEGPSGSREEVRGDLRSSVEPGRSLLEGTSAGPAPKTDWVARTPGLHSKRLNTIFIPATHDSATYELQSVYTRPVDDLFAPDSKLPIIRAGQFIGVSDAWAKTQERDIRTQLADGIRDLDLRPCREKSGALRICHAMYGPLMSDILEQIRVFVEAHPLETARVRCFPVFRSTRARRARSKTACSATRSARAGSTARDRCACRTTSARLRELLRPREHVHGRGTAAGRSPETCVVDNALLDEQLDDVGGVAGLREPLSRQGFG